MKKIILILLSAIFISANAQTASPDGYVYKKEFELPYKSYDNTKTIRANMNAICQALSVDTNMITFYYNSAFDWQFITYSGFSNGDVFVRNSPSNDDVIKYNSLTHLRQNNVSTKDSANIGWFNDKPNYLTTSSANSLYKSSSYQPTLSVTGYSLTAGSNIIAIPNPTIGLGYVPLQSFTEVDGSSTNEIQSLSINSNSIILSNGGGTITLPSQTTQTITGANGISIASSANTFTISKTKRQEVYSVTTNSLGVSSVTFAVAYSVAPNIQANIVGGTSNQIITMTVSTTGFTVTVVQRNAVTLLATEVLLASTVNVNEANVDVLITEK